MTPKNTMCLWFDKDAQEAARFYDATFLARPQPRTAFSNL